MIYETRNRRITLHAPGVRGGSDPLFSWEYIGIGTYLSLSFVGFVSKDLAALWRSAGVRYIYLLKRGMRGVFGGCCGSGRGSGEGGKRGQLAGRGDTHNTG